MWAFAEELDQSPQAQPHSQADEQLLGPWRLFSRPGNFWGTWENHNLSQATHGDLPWEHLGQHCGVQSPLFGVHMVPEQKSRTFALSWASLGLGVLTA